MTVIEEHANWTISRELGFNYSYAGQVRQTPPPGLATQILNYYLLLQFTQCVSDKTSFFTSSFNVKLKNQIFVVRLVKWARYSPFFIRPVE